MCRAKESIGIIGLVIHGTKLLGVCMRRARYKNVESVV